MSPVLVVVADVLIQQPSQVPLVQNNHVVQELSAHTADPTLRNPVLPRTAECRPERLASATPFCHGLRNAVRSGWLPSAFTVETTSELNFESRSNIRKRCGCLPSSHVSCNCRATQRALGLLVTLW